MLYLTFCSSTYKSNTRSFLVVFYPKKTSILPCLMVFKLQIRLLDISSCRLACKTISQNFHFALTNISTSAAFYFISFKILTHHAYIVAFWGWNTLLVPFPLTLKPLDTLLLACLTLNTLFVTTSWHFNFQMYQQGRWTYKYIKQYRLVGF